MARRVKLLRGQEHFGFNVGVVHPVQPLADGVDFGGGVLPQFGAELAPGQFHILRLGGQRIPGDVLHGVPAALDGFLVEGGGVVRPQFVLAVDGVVVQAGHTRRGVGAAGHSGHFPAFVGDFAVDAGGDGLDGEAVGRGDGAGAPLAGVFHPGETLGGRRGRDSGFDCRRGGGGSRGRGVAGGDFLLDAAGGGGTVAAGGVAVVGRGDGVGGMDAVAGVLGSHKAAP